MSNDFKEGDYVAVHENPVWRGKADFIIRTRLEGSETSSEWEQLWARQVEQGRFMICCIPFFAYDLALGDEVETDESFTLTKIVSPSGQRTFRVWFGETQDTGIKEKVLQTCEAQGLSYEWSSTNLVAISASDLQAPQLADFLQSHENAGNLRYETGRT